MKPTDMHAECDNIIDELNEECDALARTLHDLKSHVENARMDAFRYPDTVRELLDRAETLLDGEMPAIVEEKREVEAENEQLRGTMKRAAHVVMNRFPPTEAREQTARILRDALDGGGDQS